MAGGVEFVGNPYEIIGFSIINHPFWGTPIFGNTPMDLYLLLGGGVSQVMTHDSCHVIVATENTTDLTPKGSVLEGKSLKLSGKSSLVKYYNLVRFCGPF